MRFRLFYSGWLGGIFSKIPYAICCMSGPVFVEQYMPITTDIDSR